MKTDRWNAAVRKLIDLTESESLTWKATDDIGLARAGECLVAGPAYIADVDDRTIAIYEAVLAEDDGNIHFGDTFTVIEFVDDRCRRQWKWPVSGPLAYELIETIRYKTSKADSFLSTFLADQQPA
jgi:hypothetical protein